MELDCDENFFSHSWTSHSISHELFDTHHMQLTQLFACVNTQYSKTNETESNCALNYVPAKPSHNRYSYSARTAENTNHTEYQTSAERFISDFVSANATCAHASTTELRMAHSCCCFHLPVSTGARDFQNSIFVFVESEAIHNNT